MNKRQIKKKQNKYKQFIHFQVPINENGYIMDAQIIAKFLEYIQPLIGKNSTCIATPFIPTVINKKLGMSFENVIYTENEIKEMIKLYEENKKNKATYMGLSTTLSNADGTNITEPVGNGYSRIPWNK